MKYILIYSLVTTTFNVQFQGSFSHKDSCMAAMGEGYKIAGVYANANMLKEHTVAKACEKRGV
jgi:hypothetical protein